MPTNARNVIDSHRLMRTETKPSHEVRVDAARGEIDNQVRVRKQIVRRHAIAHVVIFCLSFIFTAGFLVLGILLWVGPDSLVALVVVGLFSASVFVATFSALRMFVLHQLFSEYKNTEEDPGMQHHLGKSVTYGFLALVLAVVLAGFLINIATAFTA